MKTPNPGFSRLVKVPCLLLLMLIGFVLEFLIELPFAVMCAVERHFGRHSP